MTLFWKEFILEGTVQVGIVICSLLNGTQMYCKLTYDNNATVYSGCGWDKTSEKINGSTNMYRETIKLSLVCCI